MKTNSRSVLIMGIVLAYIILQFLWWEVLLVKQNGKIINEKQKWMELSSTNETQLEADLAELHQRKNRQTLMIVGEGTVFLLLLLFGIYKIKQSHDKEQQFNKQQNNFFLSITHELKTPITATKLQLQTLQKQKLNETVQQELIAGALLETERLNMLIDNVLLVSRLDTGAFIFNFEKQELTQFLSNLLQRYYKKEMEKGEVVLEFTKPVYAAIDVHAFPSIVTNLVDNALKYSKSTKKIKVQVETSNNRVKLSVCDQGAGVADSEKLKIVEKFYRIENEETRSSKGTGLGLYIVNYIAKQHQATLGIKNNMPIGSIFEIELDAI